jgi:hypothetical protein
MKKAKPTEGGEEWKMQKVMTTAKQQFMKYNIPSFNVNYPALHIL